MRTSWLLQDAWRSITRHRASFAMATAVQAVCLTLLGMFVLAALGLANLTDSTRKQVEVQVFLDTSADPVQLESRISRISGVTATRYVTSDEALADLRSQLEADSSVLAVLDANPLPASVRVTLAPGVGVAELADIEHKLSLLPGVSEVWSGSETIARLARILKVLIAATLAIVIVSSLAVAFVVFQTVESSLLSRAREIEIMELVGATRFAVRAPFVIEGCIQGALGGVLSCLLLLGLSAVASLIIIPIHLPLGSLAGASIGLGLLLGLLGSLFALGRLDQ